MDIKNLNNILNAFTNVLPQLGINNIEKAGMSLKEKFVESHGVIVIIGMIGDLKGNIIYSLTQESAKKIASKMMMGMPVNNLDELAQSAISELINMLTANAATNFSNDNINVDISTPTLICGEFVANTNAEKIICININTDVAPIEVNIALEEQ
ncbi:chemotaxis protein CheX [Clostridium sp. HCP1S3_B4]|uniref:chemotaxis protein CheX n=1 Tax=unclassified Clostridium TaxID=2614128 RepID=UPI002A7DC9DA|nr:chemotaxis protein CheX [Clostridium sp.]